MWSSVHGLPTVPRPHPGPLENFRGPTSMFAYSRYSKRKSRTSHARAQQASRFICVPFRLSLSSWDLTGLQSRGEPSS